MARGPTVAELLKAAKKKRDKIQKKAIADVEKLIPPIFGPAGRAAPTIARGITEIENTIMDHLLERAFRDLANVEIPLVPQQRMPEVAEVPVRTKRVRSDKQLINDQIQSNALKSINIKARKKDGSFKKGWNQKKVMRWAQRECTKERERLGLCERKSTRKGQVRKTARRAYKK